jgi:hypothetical protein
LVTETNIVGQGSTGGNEIISIVGQDLLGNMKLDIVGQDLLVEI